MILLGTSGYSFPDWVGPFYPPGTDRRDMLDYYVRSFPAVEINSTYYRIPPASTLHAMERKTPPTFEFVVKANREMTHDRSLDAELYRTFAGAIEPLRSAGKLSGVLAQFPFGFHRSPQNEKFLVELRHRLPEVPLFIEFRHESWIGDDVFPWLEEQGLGYVSVDEPDLPGLLPPIARATGDVGYVRFHGRNKKTWWSRDKDETQAVSTKPAPAARRAEKSYGPLFSGEAGVGGGAAQPAPGHRGRSLLRYDYLYSEAELKEWTDKIRELATSTKKTFVFFNNCHVGQAATGAKLMRRLLEGEGLLG